MTEQATTVLDDTPEEEIDTQSPAAELALLKECAKTLGILLKGYPDHVTRSLLGS